MKDSTYYLLVGFILVAPHLNEILCLALGLCAFVTGFIAYRSAK